MVDGLRPALLVVAAVGGGVMAGAYFAFSSFVMPALRGLPTARGIVAMQAINRAAPTAWFMAALFGTAAASVAVAVSTVGRLDDDAAWWALAGSGLYLASVGLTAAWHVPRNDALAAVDADAPSAIAAWDRYLAEWLPWNHVRALTCIAATVCFVVALARR